MSDFWAGFKAGVKEGWAEGWSKMPRLYFLPIIWPCEALARAVRRLARKLAAQF